MFSPFLQEQGNLLGLWRRLCVTKEPATLCSRRKFILTWLFVKEKAGNISQAINNYPAT